MSVEAYNVGLDINTEKTECMYFNLSPDAPAVSLEGNNLNIVPDF